MKQQPDKLFREKLQRYQPAVSADAWKRISENLGAQPVRMVWLKIAASLLLLLAAGIVIFPALKRTDTGPLPEHGRLAAEETPVVIDKPQPGNTALSADSARTWEQQRQEKAPAKSTRRPLAVKTTAPGKNDGIAASPPASEHSDLPAAESDTSSPANPASRGERYTTIVYTAEEVDKYLMKKNAGVDATPGPEETSSFQKLLDKAYDLKHNQDAIGNLRQKKNEILAMNFKSNKQRHENE